VVRYGADHRPQSRPRGAAAPERRGGDGAAWCLSRPDLWCETIGRLRVAGYPMTGGKILSSCGPLTEMTAMISRVANLGVASIGSIGDNLSFAGLHSHPAALLIAVNTLMPDTLRSRRLSCPGRTLAATGPAEAFVVPAFLPGIERGLPRCRATI
jgi:hypothetical protein